MRKSEYFSPEYHDFLDYAIDFTRKNRKKIEIRPVSYLILKGGRCAGYCYDGDIFLAGYHSLAESTFIHEFSHTTQFLEQSPLWHTDGDYEEHLIPNLTLQNLFLKGISGFQYFYNAIKLERDCEKRALKFIKKFNLPLDLELYAQRANAYLFYYHYIFLKRKWTDSTTLYKKELIDLMPKKLVSLQKLRVLDMDFLMEMDRILG